MTLRSFVVGILVIFIKGTMSFAQSDNPFKTQFVYHLPFLQFDSTEVIMEHISTKAIIDNYIVYELPYHTTELNTSSEDQINPEMIYDSSKFEFFRYKSNSAYGYQVKDNIFKIFPTDSFLKNRTLLLSDDLGMQEPNDSIIERKEVIIVPTKKIWKYNLRDPNIDSVHFHYENNLSLHFALSKKLDSIRGSKLYQLTYFLKGKTTAGKSRYVSMRIEKAPISNLPIIKQYVRHIETLESKNNNKNQR